MRGRWRLGLGLLLAGTVGGQVTVGPADAAVAITRQGCVVLAVDAYDNDEFINVAAADAGGSQLVAQIEPLTLTCESNLVTATVNLQYLSPVEMTLRASLFCVDPAVPGGCTPELISLPQAPTFYVLDSTAYALPGPTQARTATFVFPNVPPGNYRLSTRIQSIALIDYTIGGPRVLTIHAIGEPVAGGGGAVNAGRP